MTPLVSRKMRSNLLVFVILEITQVKCINIDTGARIDIETVATPIHRLPHTHAIPESLFSHRTGIQPCFPRFLSRPICAAALVIDAMSAATYPRVNDLEDAAIRVTLGIRYHTTSHRKRTKSKRQLIDAPSL